MFWKNDELTELAMEIVKEEPIFAPIIETGTTFVVCKCDKAKHNRTMTTYGDCRSVPEAFRWCVPYEFQITIYEPNVADLSEEQMRILLFHELLHIGVEMGNGAPKKFIRSHDVEDFKCIIAKYGTEWGVPGER